MKGYPAAVRPRGSSAPADASLVSAHGEPLAVHAPFDGGLIGEVATATPDDIAAAIRTARTAQRSWADVPPRERAKTVTRFAGLVLEEEPRILDVIQLESGKSRLSAYEEVMDVARACAFYARHAEELLRTRRRPGALPVLTRSAELRHPKGVVGIITPWNYPFTLVATDAIPALLAGNAVVLKPDSKTPFTALLVLELLLRAGLPRDLFQLVPGAGPAVGPPLIADVDYVMFTGSTRTGREVAEQCASRLIGCSAELGGKNPLLVLADADLPAAAHGAVKACFSNTGQLCISVERLYVDQQVRAEFVAQFVAETKALRIEPGYDWGVDVGCLASQQQLDRVASQVADAVAKGATVLAGGRARPDLGPLCYEPTILTDVPGDALLAREETFGPVVAIYPVADDAEAVARANDTDYGLSASVWSSSAAHAWRVARQLEAGMVSINDAYVAGWGTHSSPMVGGSSPGSGVATALRGS